MVAVQLEKSVPGAGQGGNGNRGVCDAADVSLKVNSANVIYGDNFIESIYNYENVEVGCSPTGDGYVATPKCSKYRFRTSTRVSRLGLMLVGWGGNNGSTVTAAVLANKRKLTWRTREGVQSANYIGSITQASTVRIGNCGSDEVYVPLNKLLPMVNPDDIVISGWDICSRNLAQAAEYAKVLEPTLLDQIQDDLASLKPLPSIYYPDFIAANQKERANNLIPGTRRDHLAKIKSDIEEFKRKNELDLVIVLWTANTERYSDIAEGVNDTAENILAAINSNKAEVSPSTVFAVAAIQSGCPFINGSPQNTFVPGVIDLAVRKKVFIGGDDFKSGQTKLKSVLADFLVTAGIKPLAVTSYNHLGNNDGWNLSSPRQFRSKEISKSSVIDDMVKSNSILYTKAEHPDHTVVIKYVPSVGDSKRALDEYYSEIFMGGRSSISIYNICEDSLLASPIILDLAILAELMTRIKYKKENDTEWRSFHPVMSILSYLLKAPLVVPGTPVINSLSRQRKAIENILKACIGLPPENDMNMEFRCSSLA